MKYLKIFGLGITIWSTTLLWPEMGLFFSSPVMIGVAIGFSLTMLIYLLEKLFRHLYHANRNTAIGKPGFKRKSGRRSHHSMPTRPMLSRYLHSQRTRPMYRL